MTPAPLRAVAIGSTMRGGFGHGLDSVWHNLPGVEYAALADDDPAGLAAAGKKLGVTRLYADFRQMLEQEQPDLTSIGPRWVDQRVEMTAAAAEAGCHIYCEKPLAGRLADADAMLAACESAGCKLAVAHQFRAMPPVRQTHADVTAGRYGKLLRMRARPKDDHRGGGEELIVHGTHLLDLMVHFAGAPQWVSAHISEQGREAVLADRRQASEPLGPVLGDSIAALFGFAGGVRGCLDTTRNLYRDGRSPYGLLLECEEALLHVRARGEVYVYAAPNHIPEAADLTWERQWVADWHFTPEHLPRSLDHYLHEGNQILALDLLAAIAEDRPPLAPGAAARDALEMIQGAYASHLQGGLRLAIPLAERRHPLE